MVEVYSEREKTQYSVPSTQYFVLALILLGYLLVAALFAVFTPPWQAPDEPAHYNYVAQVARTGCCPVIEVGEWDSAYLDQLKSLRFPPELLGDLDTIQYEDHQPPLYYLLASVIFKLTGGSLIALRLFSVLLGAGVVLSAYRIGSAMCSPWIGLGAAAFVAFLPQHVAMMAAINNDALAETLIGLTLLATIQFIKNGSVGTRFIVSAPIFFGVLVGIGLLTKLSTLFLVGIVPLAIVLKWWGNAVGAHGGAPLRGLVRNLIVFFIPVLLLGGIWWARNIGVYGWPDFLGLRAHDLVVADQLRTADFVASIGSQQYLITAISTTYHSFWGQFGWMALPMPGWIYTLIGALLLVVIGGLALISFIPTPLRREGLQDELVPPLHAMGRGSGGGDDRAYYERRSAWIILSLTALLALLAYVYYNTEFVQFQGRYLFPGLIPFALWMALGLDAWRRLLLQRIEWFAAVALFPFALLDVYLLWRVIVPGLAP